mmetsp:Transcript_9976/g.25803  ORF Transcript_9976/g.25803 Transcript_9976/m.25803 type:complete len:521 (-) Transcript_9976:76-1638(-)
MNAWVVVREDRLVPDDLLAVVLLLLLLEDDVVEYLLEHLVRRVDEELLEAVDPHVLEAEDVEDADKLRVRGRVNVEGHVDASDEPVEELGVDRLGGRIAQVHRLLLVVRRGDRGLARDLAHAVDEGVLELGGRDAEHAGGRVERARRGAVDRRVVRVGELDVAELEHTRDDLHHAVDLGVGDVDRLHRLDSEAVLLGVVHVRDGGAHLGVLLRRGAAVEAVLGGGASLELVEDVEVALALSLVHDARLLEEQVGDVAPGDRVLRRVVQRGELAEARRVVVAERLGVAEGLHERVRLDDLLAHGHAIGGRAALVALGDDAEVLEHELGGLGLAGARLTADDHGLVELRLDELLVGVLGLHEAVRGLRAIRTVMVRLDDLLAVDGQPLEWVHRDEDRARVRVNLVHTEAEVDVREDRRFVERRQVVHILHAVQRDRLHRHALEQAARWFLLLARGGRERSLDVNLHGLALNSLDSGDVAADTLEDGLNVGLGRVRDPAQAACVGVRPVGGVVHIGCWYETEW